MLDRSAPYSYTVCMRPEDFDFHMIAGLLQNWFSANARVLPWRLQQTPYHVWLSEIMLQQTRVEAVIGYYDRFLRTLPDIRALSEATEDEYLKLWEGLGYYSRVRNLSKASKEVMERFGGELPSDVEELLKLPGIGSYTAGAIASLAYGKRVPAVDGNVLRVMMRITGDPSDIAEEKTKKRLQSYLQSYYDTAGSDADPRKLNQALMELGALVCIPNGKPDCAHCPVSGNCQAFLTQQTHLLPVKQAKKERRIEKRTVFLIRLNHHLLLHKRPEKGLLAGLYELPNTEGYLSEEEAAAFVKQLGLIPVSVTKTKPAKHIFTHIEWHMNGYEIPVIPDSSYTNPDERLSAGNMAFFSPEELKHRIALPSAFAAFQYR